jgi:(1->4)-alpha-D-glucan 1-alpha-D-glucosylmutase
MRVPVATYRLQFGPSLRFQDAKALVPYLAELGISDLYASPILQATPGSTHGYDVTDPDALNPELGTEEDFQALVAEVRAHEMGWLQDIVPNHMAYSSANRMLMDVFENGPRSRFYDFFDIFRDHPDPKLRTTVLAPFLGGPLEEVLHRGEMQLVLDDDGLALRYFTWRFPLSLASYDDVLGRGDPMSGSQGGVDPGMRAFAELRESFARLSGVDDSAQKRRHVADAKKTLVRLYREHPMIRLYLEGVLDSYHRPPQGPTENSPVYRLLEQQVFQPVFWQVAHETINYRRFFYLSEFIALRTEEPRVFHGVHGKILELVRAGVFTGLRVDHIDGLYNPRQYLLRLQQEAPQAYLVVEKILELYEFLRTEWPIQGTSGYKFCNYVNGLFCQRENEQAFTDLYQEFIGSAPDYAQLLYDEKKKILESHMGGELAYLTHLAQQASRALDTGDAEDPDDESAPSRTGRGNAGPGAATLRPPPSATSVRNALAALMAGFPVYRTYVDAYRSTREDQTVLTRAIETARDKCPECRPGVDYVVKLLLSALQGGPESPAWQARRYFLMRFQQFTGPAMAKGFEDTLLYVYNRFVSLNEVGGDPNTFGLALNEFHRFHQMRARDWPHAMNATSTHDSKRGEDVRARLNVLSEIPGRWRQAVTRWARMNERHKQPCDGVLAPDRNDEYLLYQTLVGALPFEVSSGKWEVSSRDSQATTGASGDLPPPTSNLTLQTAWDDFTQRIKDYVVKAVREAKTHSNWVQPNEPYEIACQEFVHRILERTAENPFWADFLPFQREVSAYGIYNSLSQTTLKIACTGLPDFYQGSELWDLNLVDPDNRRPVDFEKRARLLKEVQRLRIADCGLRIMGESTNPQSAIPNPQLSDGRIKLFLMHRGLRARRENRDLFDSGDYLPAAVTGTRAQHIVAFFRSQRVTPEAQAVTNYILVVAPRFLTSLVNPGDLPLGEPVWGDTGIRLPRDAPATWRNAITDETLHARGEIPVGDVLAHFPTAILVGRASPLAS